LGTAVTNGVSIDTGLTDGAMLKAVHIQIRGKGLAMVAIFLMSCSPRGSAPVPPGEEGFVSLFNGETLDGWVVEPKPDAMEMYGVEGGMEDSFGVVDGTIARLKGGYSWIRSEDEYGDFVLKVEYKIVEGGNSGIHLRVADPSDEVYTGIEMQILGDYGSEPSIHSTGAIYDVLAPRVNAARPSGEWNEVTIECRGSWIRIDLNGQRIIEMNMDEWTEPVGKFKTPYAKMPRSGYIGFQNHGSEVYFRNVRLKRLTPQSA
jgi:hypothetical protein